METSIAAVNIAAQQTALLVQLHYSSTQGDLHLLSDSEVSNRSECSAHQHWSCPPSKLLGILHGTNTEHQKMFALRHYTLCSALTRDASHCTELQMMLIDHIASPNTSPEMKNSAVSCLAANVRESGHAPIVWHRFVLGIVMQNRSTCIITPYLGALRYNYPILCMNHSEHSPTSCAI